MNSSNRLPADDTVLLDAEVLHALASAQVGEPPAPELAARVKQKLLRQMAEAEDSHVTVQAADDLWRPFLPGVKIRVLHESQGVMSYLLRIDPGASVPAHRHPHDEECVVLEGVLRIGELVVPAGGFHLARKDTLHARLDTDTGSTLFLRGAAPRREHVF